MKSESIAELAAALAKAQGAMEGAKKNSANPFFKSKYADLAECWDACREPLSKNNLSIIQPVRFSGGKVIVETIMAHSSGEWISEELEMNPVKVDPQGIGSIITYARRYGLCAMVGIAPEDDDVEAAMGRKETAAKPTKKYHDEPAPADDTERRKTILTMIDAKLLKMGANPADEKAKKFPNWQKKQPTTDELASWAADLEAAGVK